MAFECQWQFPARAPDCATSAPVALAPGGCGRFLATPWVDDAPAAGLREAIAVQAAKWAQAAGRPSLELA